VGPGEAWAAVASERSHFRTAARGAASALPFLLAALAISLLAAAFAAVLARARDLFPGRSRRIALAAATAGLCALVVYPLLPLVPALAAAAVFVCAKEDQDPASSGNASGLGALIRAAMSEPSVAERIGSCALVAGALVVLWYLGHRFLLEARESLGAQRSAP